MRIHSYSRSSRNINSIENLINEGCEGENKFSRQKFKNWDHRFGKISFRLNLFSFSYFCTYLHVFPKVRNEMSIDRKFLHVISYIVYILSLNFVLHIFSTNFFISSRSRIASLSRMTRLYQKIHPPLEKNPSGRSETRQLFNK